MVGVFELFHLVSSLSDNLSKAPVIHAVLPIQWYMWYYSLLSHVVGLMSPY